MDIDDVLAAVGMGRYQILGILLFGLMTMYTNMSPVTYIFTAVDLKYRCVIPGCDDSNAANRTYEPKWLRLTTPYSEKTGQPLKCKRFMRTINPISNGTQCGASDFDPNAEERCADWVYEEYANTVGTEFGFMCEDNKWQLSLVGIVNNIGRFVGSPFSGIIADRLGRKFAMIFGVVSSSIVCIIQSFSINFPMFLCLEFASSFLTSGVYTVTYVLAMELMVPKHRVVCYSLLECFFPAGAMLMTYIASQTKNWRLLLQISNIPPILFLSYIWFTEESMRWMEMRGKRDKVIAILTKIARVNNQPLPAVCSNSQIKSSPENNGDETKRSTFNVVIHSSAILWRTFRCSIVWISTALIYYGLSINATDIAGNKYLNFALVSGVEIPASLLNMIIMAKMSRRISLSSVFVLNGIACVLYIFVPNELATLKLSCFMLSKLAISIAYCIIHMLTMEIFPTEIRVTMVSVCCMMGQIGATGAPLTTLMTPYFGEPTTMLVFGSMAFLAAAVTMTLPESKNIKLPDTIEQAEMVGHDVDEAKAANNSSS